MKWMSAGAALMGISLPACRRVEKYLVPYNEGPEWSVPGMETAYATCLNSGSRGVPLLAACHEGRPVKLIASLQYPEGPGLSAAAQSSILELYDPGRSKHILFGGTQASEDEFRGAFAAWSRNLKNGGRIGFLLPPSDSPLLQSMMEEIRRKNPQARFYTSSPVADPGSGMRESLPSTIRFRVRFAKVRRLLTLDCDFLHENPFGNTRDFIAARSPEGLNYKDSNEDRLRLYAAEGRVSLTGAHADHRLPIPPSRIPLLVRELFQYLMGKTNPTQDTPLADSSSSLLKQEEISWIHHCADDLASRSGTGFVLLGDHYPDLAPYVWRINHMLGAIGSCVQFMKGPEPEQAGSLEDLIRDINNKNVELVFLLDDSNPVWNAPEGMQLAQALHSTESIHLGLYANETSAVCRWHLPGAHPLESWGVERDGRGRFCYRQPVILPLYGGISTAEILSGLLSSKGQLITADTSPTRVSPVYHRARKCFERTVNPEDKTAAWSQALQRGYSEETAYPALTPDEETQLAQSMQQPEWRPVSNLKQFPLELQFTPDYSVGDGSRKRNAWMQECPDPITGVSWAASAQISPASFRQLGGNGTTPARAIITTPAGRMEVILCPIPGVTDHLIALPLGYGGINPTAEEQTSSDAYPLRQCTKHSQHPGITPEQITLLPLEKNTEAIHSPSPLPSPFSDTTLTTPGPPRVTATDQTHYQWKMSIDASRCIGCNACMIACRAENNIPTVGKDQMARGRGLDWIRMDKYLTEQGIMTAIPVACQQCGKAPCESVCPVNATVHTSEGLNAMVYGRCWGTRYCAANCPYKARRFNFFDYAKASEQSTRLQRNQNVTVRTRGVMEKCTYCVQMVERAKIRHKSRLMKAHPGQDSVTIHLTDQELMLPDGAVQTACQLACPMGAITFGNIMNPASAVSRTKALPRHVNLLAALGTDPGTGYLRPVSNPNPKIK